MKHNLRLIFSVLFLFLTLATNLIATDIDKVNKDSYPDGYVLVLDMDLIILPGTGEYLKKAVDKAYESGAKAIIVKLNTPGGMLNTTQEIIQTIFSSKVPVIIYVSPAGSTATSAGVFITMAAHVAAMAPGTSLGAAHPVTGEGKDIEGDMRKKAENMTTALVRSITEQRGRNVEWVEKAVRESESITAKEALEKNVVDIVAKDIEVLLTLTKGRKIKLNNQDFTLADYSKLPRIDFKLGVKEKLINTLANPQILALLWLAAVTGLFMELKNPGLIVPGTVGVICLVLALPVSQIIPINQGGVLLLILGAVLIGFELFVPSGVLGIGGIVSIVLGLLYLVDEAKAPGLEVGSTFAVMLAVVFGGFLLIVIKVLSKDLAKSPVSGLDGIIGKRGVTREKLAPNGRVFLEGTFWKAKVIEDVIEKNEDIEVVDLQKSPLTLIVKKV